MSRLFAVFAALFAAACAPSAFAPASTAEPRPPSATSAPLSASPAPSASPLAAPVSPTPSAAPSAASATVAGKVGGAAFTPREAIFLWREKADDMRLYFSDAEDLCAAVEAGAWPSGAAVLTITLKLNADRDGAFGAGDYPVRGSGDRAPRDTKRATLLHLDAGCRPTARSDATAGTVRLRGGAVSPSALTEGELDLTFPDGSLKGPFTASFCKPPEMELQGCK